MLEVDIYSRPSGRVSRHTIRNIRQEDANWFEANNASVSMEDIGGQFVLYADIGRTLNGDPDEEPDEVIILSAGRNCEDSMSALREACQEALEATP